MLCLTRGIGEIVDIGPGIEVMVLEINGNQVRLGISAPKDVPVHRREVMERIKANQKGNADEQHTGMEAG